MKDMGVALSGGVQPTWSMYSGRDKGSSRFILLTDIYLFMQIKLHKNAIWRNLEYIIRDFEVLNGKQKD